MKPWLIVAIIYAAFVVSWCAFALLKRDKVMSPNNSQGLNITFLIVSIIFAPVSWCIGVVMMFQSKKGDWPKPVPEKLRNCLKKDTVIYHNKSMSLAAYNKLTGNNVTLEQVYGKRYVMHLTEDDYRQFDTIGERLCLEEQHH